MELTATRDGDDIVIGGLTHDRRGRLLAAGETIRLRTFGRDYTYAIVANVQRLVGDDGEIVAERGTVAPFGLRRSVAAFWEVEHIPGGKVVEITEACRCADCGCTGQPHFFVNTGAEVLCVDCA